MTCKIVVDNPILIKHLIDSGYAKSTSKKEEFNDYSSFEEVMTKSLLNKSFDYNGEGLLVKSFVAQPEKVGFEINKAKTTIAKYPYAVRLSRQGTVKTVPVKKEQLVDIALKVLFGRNASPNDLTASIKQEELLSATQTEEVKEKLDFIDNHPELANQIADVVEDPEMSQDIIAANLASWSEVPESIQDELPLPETNEIVDSEIVSEQEIKKAKTEQINRDISENEFYKPFPNSSTGQSEEMWLTEDHDLKQINRIYNAFNFLQKSSGFGIRIINDHEDFQRDRQVPKEQITGVVLVVVMKTPGGKWVNVPFDENGNFDPSLPSYLYNEGKNKSNALVLPLSFTQYFEDGKLDKRIAAYIRTLFGEFATKEQIAEVKKYFDESKKKLYGLREQTEPVDIIIDEVSVSQGIIAKRPKDWSSFKERDFDMSSLMFRVDEHGTGLYKGGVLVADKETNVWTNVFPSVWSDSEGEAIKQALLKLKRLYDEMTRLHLQFKTTGESFLKQQIEDLKFEYLSIANVLNQHTYSSQDFHVYVKGDTVTVRLSKKEPYKHIKEISEQEISAAIIKQTRRIDKSWLASGLEADVPFFDNQGNSITIKAVEYLANNLNTNIVPIDGKIRLKNRYIHFEWENSSLAKAAREEEKAEKQLEQVNTLIKESVAQAFGEKLEDVNVKLQPSGGLKYHPATKTIHVGADFFKWTNRKKQSAITEELFHHLTFIELSKLEDTHPIKVEALEIADKLVAWAKTQKLTSQQKKDLFYSIYGTEKPKKDSKINLNEFFARAFSDKTTRDALLAIPHTENKSLFDKLVDLFTKFINLISEKLGKEYVADGTALKRMIELNYQLISGDVTTENVTTEEESKGPSAPEFTDSNPKDTEKLSYSVESPQLSTEVDEGFDNLFLSTNPEFVATLSKEEVSNKGSVARARVVQSIDGDLVHIVTDKDVKNKDTGGPSFTLLMLYGKVNLQQLGSVLHNHYKKEWEKEQANLTDKDLPETVGQEYLQFMSNSDNFNLAFNAWIKDSKLIEESEEIIVVNDDGSEVSVNKESYDDSREEQVSEGQQKGEFDRKPGKETFFEVAEKEVRAFIMATIKRKRNDKNQIETVYGYYGRPLLADYGNLFRLVFQELNGVETLEEAIAKLRNSKKDVPEFKELADRLEQVKNWKLKADKPEGTKAYFVAAFLKTSSMTAFPYKQTHLDFSEDKTTVFVASSNLFDKFMNYWTQGMTTVYTTLKKTQDSSNINKQMLGVFFRKNDTLFIDYVKLQKLIENKTINDRQILNLLGITISNGTIIDMGDQELTDFTSYVKEGILKFSGSATKQTSSNPIQDLTTDDRSIGFLGMKRRFNRLAEFEARYSTVITSSTYNTIDGETQQLAIQTSTATNILKALNNAQHTNDLTEEASRLNPKKSILARYSLLMRSLFNFTPENPEGKATNVVLELGFVGGLKRTNVDRQTRTDDFTGDIEVTEKISTTGVATTSLLGRDYIIMDFVNLLKDGFKEFMRTQTSSAAYYFKPSGWFRGTSDTERTVLPIMSWSSGEQQRFKEYMLDYLKGELEMLHWSNTDPQAKLWTPENKSKLPVFEVVLASLNKDTKETLLNPALALENIKLLSERGNKTRAEVLGAISDFIESEIKEYDSVLASEGLSGLELWNAIPGNEELLKYVENGVRENPEAIIKELKAIYVANSFIINYEQSRIFDGDVRFFKDWHKRANIIFSHGKTLSTDEDVLEYLRATRHKTITRALGADYEVSNKISTSVIGDDYTTSNLVDEIVEGVKRSKALKGETLSKEEEDSLRTSYTEGVNIADGAGMCSLDFYRHHMLSIGNWSDAQERGYEYEVEIMKRLLKANGYETDPNEELIAQIEKERSEGLKYYFPTIKSNHRGPLAETFDENGNRQEIEGIYPEITDKFSLQPLLPSGLKPGSLGWNLAVHMAQRDIKYVKFKSGTKTNLGMLSSEMRPSFEKPAERVPTNFSNSPLKKVTVWAKNLKEQLNTQFKYKKQSIFGTQFRKLILQNLFTNKVKANGSAEVISGLEDSVDAYIASLQRLTDIAKETLLKELGAKIENNSLVFEDFNKVISLLEREAIKRDENKNVIEALKKARKKKIKLSTTLVVKNEFLEENQLPLEATFSKQTLGNILQGLINKRLVRQKVNGSMLIQVSSNLFALPAETRKQQLIDSGVPEILVDSVYRKMYGTSGVPFYYTYNEDGQTKVRKAGAMITLDGPFKNLLNLESYVEKSHTGEVPKIGTRENLNSIIIKGRIQRILKEEGQVYDKEFLKWFEETLVPVITFIGYRIPTQGLNSMEGLEVVEFLDSAHGGTIVVPAEIVTKAGSDFDIDKLPTIFPSISKEGRLITQNYVDTLVKEIEAELKQKGKEHKELLKELSSIKNGYDEIPGVESPVVIDEFIKESKKQLWEEFSKFEKSTQDKIRKLIGLAKDIEQNTVLKSSLEILTHPVNFEYLVTPNTDEIPQGVSNAIISARGLVRDKDSKGNYSGGNIMKWKSNYMKFLALAAKKLLGVAAVSNTFMTLIQRSKMTMSEDLVFTYGKDKVTVSLKNPLFTEEEWSNVTKDGRILLYLPNTTSFSLDGKRFNNVKKQEHNSQLINSTVDLPSNDYFGYTRITSGNMGALMHSINMGLSQDRFIALVNQPAVVAFEKLKQLEKGKQQRMSLDEHVLTLISAQLGHSFVRKEKGKKEYWQYIERQKAEIPSENIQEYLMSKIAIDSNLEKPLEYLASLPAEDKLVQLSLLATYIKFLEVSSRMFNVQQYLGFDTNTDQNPMSAQARLALRGVVKEDNLVDIEAVDRIRTDSPIQSFQVQDLLISMFKQVLPIQYSDVFFERALENRESVKKDNKERYDRLISNDFLAAIVQSIGKFPDYDNPIYEVGEQLLKGGFEEKWEKFKQDGFYKLVSDNPLVQKIQRIPPKESGITNYTILRELGTTKLDNDVLIDAFEQLLNHENLEVRKIFRDFAYLGISQAWFNKTPFSFTDLIPPSFYSGFVASALNEYMNLSNDSQEEFFSEFFDEFVYNNPSLFEKEGNKDSFRFKKYAVKFIKQTKEEIHQRISAQTSTTPLENVTLSDFTNHSGGAYGADTFWDIIGREFGVTNHKHYKDAGNANLSQQLKNKGVKAEILTEEQMNFARQKVKELLGIDYSIKPSDTEKQILQKNLQVRNFYQVYNADAVYAIAKINNDNKSVSGGTNTAVQLGIKLNKPVYVWDINSEKWYKFVNEKFTETETPVLTPNFAGVGSRDIEDYKIQNKDTKKWESRKEYVGKEKEEKAKQAIKDVYQKTKEELEQKELTKKTDSSVKETDKYIWDDFHKMKINNYPFVEYLLQRYQIDVAVIDLDSREDFEKSDAYYFPSKRLINIPLANTENELAFIHELIHGILYEGTNTDNRDSFKETPLSKELDVFAKEIFSIFKTATNNKKTLSETDTHVESIINSIKEGLVSQEIVTYALTDKVFAKWLSNQKGITTKSSKYNSLWNWLKKIILNGLKSEGSRLDELNEILDKHLEILLQQQESSTKGNLPMQPDNIEMIKSGRKTQTIRKEKFEDGIYTLPDGTKVEISNVYGRTIKVKDLEDSDKNRFAYAEGFKDWKDFEKNNKYSNNFINGKESRYVYSIKVVEDSSQEEDTISVDAVKPNINDCGIPF